MHGWYSPSICGNSSIAMPCSRLPLLLVLRVRAEPVTTRDGYMASTTLQAVASVVYIVVAVILPEHDDLIGAPIAA